MLTGDIIDGDIAPGMLVTIGFNSALGMTAPIETIEFIRHAGGSEVVGLCIKYETSEELDLWNGLDIGQEEIQVTPRDA